MGSRVVLILLLLGCRFFEYTSGFLLDGTVACLVPEHCKNGGECFYDANGNRKCNCQPGWEGRLCETASTTTPVTLSSHAYTGACIENERCATVSTVCDNPATALLCPVKCHLCALTTTPSTLSPHTFAGACIENEMCANVTTVCDNPTTASLCPVKCQLCAPTTTSGTHSPHTFAGACIENEMCSTMTTVCDNPTTALLCPVKCHLCASITTTSTIQHPLTYTGSCTDDDGCISKDLLEIVCSDPSLVSMCPRSCGLCSTPTVTTTLASTTQATQVSTGPGSISTMTQTTLLTPTHATKTTSPVPTTTSPTKTTSSIPTTTSPTKTTSSVATTTSPTKTTSSVPTTTSLTKSTSSIPTTTHFTSKNAVMCQTCLGPSAYCEDSHELTACEPPNNFCINHVINNRDGSRNVNRTCGNYDTCFHDWYESTSDNDRCQVFDGSIVTLAFECTYCCTVDNCNLRLHPSGDTLFIPSV